MMRGLAEITGCDAGARIGVYDGEIELVFAGVKVNKQVIDFVQHGRRPGIGPIDFVDTDDRRQSRLQRLF